MVVLIDFPKILVFPMNFNDFMLHCGDFEATLVSLGGHLGLSLGTKGPLWGILESLWAAFRIT